MPELLTESFCERCGTRYTFESTAPRKPRRLGQFKTLSKGLKNYVLSDDTSMDEAMAAARGDDERALTTQQLDAFHATFNFCMNCRQYTCTNCWNAAEGRCLTCAPNLGHEILPAPFPDDAAFQPVSSITVDAWPTTDVPLLEIAADIHAGNGSNGFDPIEHVAAEGSNGAVAEPEMESFDAIARLAFLAGESPPNADAAPAAEPEAAEPVAADPGGAEGALAQPPAIVIQGEPLPEAVDDRALLLADHTHELLGRFRPGQNIDAELAAYEAALDTAEEPVVESAADVPQPIAAAVTESSSVAEPEAAPVAAEPEAESVAAIAEPELVAREPESVVAAPEPEPTPVTPAPEPGRHDRVEQPTWRIFAPDQSPPTDRQPVAPTPIPPAAPAPVPSVSASAEPQWPARPEYPESPSMALLADRSRSRSDALWAASSREVLSPASAAASVTAGVQPCANCGLSLSASARFCRRCGSRQG